MIRAVPIALMFASVLVMGVMGGGCKTMQSSAAKDPQRCERDPGCTSKQDKSKDCATACSDNIECMERCQQVTGQGR
ncbi:hypothetical protein LVJ94_36745 [Pendulispora rubella]|uniref:Lipoprotein n=1 Tax=Pendulispora rubella TaxID=2741070 RepID=A0ABZ2KUU7_9BACT